MQQLDIKMHTCANSTLVTAVKAVAQDVLGVSLLDRAVGDDVPLLSLAAAGGGGLTTPPATAGGIARPIYTRQE